MIYFLLIFGPRSFCPAAHYFYALPFNIGLRPLYNKNVNIDIITPFENIIWSYT